MMLIRTYHVTFAVKDESSTLMENVMVEFNNESKYTNASGECVFDLNYSSGESYNISMDGYNDVSGTTNVYEDTTINITMNLTTFSVTFVVVDSDSHAIQNVRVDFNDGTKYTDVDGKAEFTEVLPEDNMTFTIKKDGYWNYDSTLNVIDEDVIFNAQLSSTTGISSVTKENLNIYPNPSSGLFNLEFVGDISNTYQIEIYNMVGSVVYSKEINGMSFINEQINISNKAKGIYFISIKCNKELVISKRLIVK